MTRYDVTAEELQAEPRTWLITGVAGFIGSNLLERLLALGQYVVGVDNFSTGHRRNLDDVLRRANGAAGHFHFIEGDVRDLAVCRSACTGADFVLHQAALGSVPRSIDDPLTSHASNVDGFINMLVAAGDARVRRFVFASSSAVYGDHPELPKREDRTGRLLSPYAATKMINELYAGVFQRVYGLQCIGLRYFNVFGRRQDPRGPYAAVIPRWVANLLDGEPCTIFGDGATSRDFCYIDNVVQANILAATVPDEAATDQVYNVACGERTTLNQLFAMIRGGLAEHRPELAQVSPVNEGFRPGDIRHSLADTTRIEQRLGYVPTHTVARGIGEALAWYVTSHGRTLEPVPSLRATSTFPAYSAPAAASRVL
ncbi:MAG TPA: SDR family oxidoreductase [Gemmatimonadaceae bacterium]